MRPFITNYIRNVNGTVSFHHLYYIRDVDGTVLLVLLSPTISVISTAHKFVTSKLFHWDTNPLIFCCVPIPHRLPGVVIWHGAVGGANIIAFLVNRTMYAFFLACYALIVLKWSSYPFCSPAQYLLNHRVYNTIRTIPTIALSLLHACANSINILDSAMKMMDKYAQNLESIVEERALQLLDEKQKTDRLLWRLLPPLVYLTIKGISITNSAILIKFTQNKTVEINFTAIYIHGFKVAVLRTRTNNSILRKLCFY